MLFWRVSCVARKHLPKENFTSFWRSFLRQFTYVIWWNSAYWQMVRKRGFVHRHFFVTEESTLLFRIAKSFYLTNSYTTYIFQMTKSLWKSKRWIDFPWCNIFEMRTERKCSVFDLLWPDPSILEGENKNMFEEQKCTTFLVLLRSTCVQKLRQFEALTLAIKI